MKSSSHIARQSDMKRGKTPMKEHRWVGKSEPYCADCGAYMESDEDSVCIPQQKNIKPVHPAHP